MQGTGGGDGVWERLLPGTDVTYRAEDCAVIGIKEKELTVRPPSLECTGLGYRLLRVPVDPSHSL